MSNNNGVFGWIRESVRRSVLLGFSDAVEQMGTAADDSEAINPQFAALLRQMPATALAAPAERPASSQPRKRLGRTLEQLREAPTSRSRSIDDDE